MDDATRDKVQAQAFRDLLAHLQHRTDAQNIDLMILAGFCRNCLWKWVKAASDEAGAGLSKEDAQQMVYGMSYADWKAHHQADASDAQKQRYEETKPLHSAISKAL